MRKPFNFFVSNVTSSALLISIFFFSGCGKDDDTKTTLIDITKPDVVAKSLTVENSTYISTGNPPPQTVNETAPILDNSTDGDPLLSIQGSKIIVAANLQAGSASGFYVKIKGADGYYKVTSTSATGRKSNLSKSKLNLFGNQGRTKDDDVASFSVEVPDNIKPGEFCISYCVYDAQNQVSNVIEQCVTVTSLGGDGSSFLSTNEWAVEHSTSYYGDSVVEETPGKINTYTYDEDIKCGDSFNTAEVTETYVHNYSYLTFSSKGGFIAKSELYQKTFDYDSSECQPVYIEDTRIFNFDGAWSYDKNSKILIIIYNEENDDETGYETVAEQFETSIADGKLVLKVSYTPTEYDIITLIPKK